MKEFDLKEFALDVRFLFKYTSNNNNNKFKFYYDDNLPEKMVSDKDRLLRIVTNLLMNA